MTRHWLAGDVAAAAAALTAGGLVAFPTETVYGLGADALSDRAIAALYAAKGRPSFNPLILHVADLAAAAALADLPEAALRLADAFWPGPLTLVAPLRAGTGVSSLALAGLPTVALRVPAHPLAQALLRAVGGPVAAPSANRSGKISPTRAAHVLVGLAGRIAGVIDGGACPVGVESTIIGFDPRGAVLLRPGGLAPEPIEALLGDRLHPAEAGAITAPGQLTSHYAPRAALRMNAAQVEPGEVLLGFGPVANATFNLSPTGDAEEAAANLFAALHMLDGQAARIAVSPIPDTGLGRAINDRLRRAAAPRPAGEGT